MVHGNPTWSFYYRELVKSLSPEYRVIVPDHIGCGLSDKPLPGEYAYRLKQRTADLETLIDRLDLHQKLTLMVHDWGGAIALAAAVKKPERIGRLIVFNTAAFLLPAGKKLPLRLRVIRNIAPLAAPAVLGLNLFARAAIFMAPRKRLSAHVRAGLLAPYNCWRNRIATLMFVRDIPLRPSDASFEEVASMDHSLHRLSGLPVLICWGEHDFVFDLDYLEEWQRRFPEAEVHRFADAGHYLLEDVPEKITPLVKRFLKSHPL